MENTETKPIEKDAETENINVDVPDELYTGIAVNTLTQNRDLAGVLHKILTLCSLSKTVDPKIITWVSLTETITKREFEELSKIQKNFDFQITNRDFRNDEKLKQQFAIQEQGKMTKKLTSLVDVPMIDETLIKSQINLNDAEYGHLTPFYFPVKNIDIVAVIQE